MGSWIGATGAGARHFCRRAATATWVAAILIAGSASCREGAVERNEAPPLPSLRFEGMDSTAAAALRQAQERATANPNGADANGALGMALQAYGLLNESLPYYHRAAQLAHRDWRWPYYLGSVHDETGRHREAAEYFRTALSLQPESVAARFRLGNALLADGRPDESRRVFAASVEQDPSSAAAHYGLGRACAAAGDSTAALRSYMRALDLAPMAGAVRYALAMLYEELDRTADAARQLELAGTGSRLEPAFDDPLMVAVDGIRIDKHTYLEKGLRLEREGLLAEAVRAYQEAVELDGGYPQPRINLVSAYGKLGRFDEAEGQYRRALEISPDSEELHVNWGTILARRNRLQEASASFRRALEINPHAASTRSDLGWVLDRSGQTSEAVAQFRLALKQEPGHRAANFHLARHLVGEGRVEAGIGHLLKTLDPVDDRTPTYMYGLADAYLRADQSELALTYLRRARELAAEMDQPDLAQEIELDLRALEAARRP